MGIFDPPNQQETHIADEVFEWYRDEVMHPFVSEWKRNRVRPSDLNEDIKKRAKEAVMSSFGEPPSPRAPEQPDNTTSNVTTVLFVMTLGVSILVGIALPPIGVIGAIASFFWLFMGTLAGGRQTPQDMLEKSNRQHQQAINEWETRREKCKGDVARILRRRLHIAIAATTKVPERALMDFIAISESNSAKYRKDWIDVIREWESKPKFAEPPRPISQGVSPFEYEQYCAETLISWGYTTARRTRQSNDGGVDIVSDELAVQCKRYVGSVGVAPVREIFGVATHMGKTAVMITEGTFTSAANDFANAAGVALFKLDARLGNPKPLNGHANNVMKHHH
jgi:hypothetical protein